MTKEGCEECKQEIVTWTSPWRQHGLFTHSLTHSFTGTELWVPSRIAIQTCARKEKLSKVNVCVWVSPLHVSCCKVTRKGCSLLILCFYKITYAVLPKTLSIVVVQPCNTRILRERATSACWPGPTQQTETEPVTQLEPSSHVSPDAVQDLLLLYST